MPFVPFDGAVFWRAALQFANLDFFSEELNETFSQFGRMIAILLIFGPLFVEKKGYYKKRKTV